MPNSSRTCKMGEAADFSGAYECLNCKYSGVRTEVVLERGKLLPMCAVCKDTDTTWRFKKAS